MHQLDKSVAPPHRSGAPRRNPNRTGPSQKAYHEGTRNTPAPIQGRPTRGQLVRRGTNPAPQYPHSPPRPPRPAPPQHRARLQPPRARTARPAGHCAGLDESTVGTEDPASRPSRGMRPREAMVGEPPGMLQLRAHHGTQQCKPPGGPRRANHARRLPEPTARNQQPTTWQPTTIALHTGRERPVPRWFSPTHHSPVSSRRRHLCQAVVPNRKAPPQVRDTPHCGGRSAQPAMSVRRHGPRARAQSTPVARGTGTAADNPPRPSLAPPRPQAHCRRGPGVQRSTAKVPTSHLDRKRHAQC